MKPNKTPNILFLDIETAPMTSYIWRLWKQDIGLNLVESDWHMLSWAGKWMGDKKIISDVLPNYKKEYKENTENDIRILESLWEVIDAADIVVAHNGNKFDIPKINARLLYNGFTPPSPYRQIDTCLIARSIFGFTSNKLDYLAQYLGVGEKTKHEGFDLWRKCLQGDTKSWGKMEKYNRNDVVLLEKVFHKLAPWSKSFPNFDIYTDDNKPHCVACGNTNIINRGFAYTQLGKFHRYQCKLCGKWMRGRKNVLTKTKKTKILTNKL